MIVVDTTVWADFFNGTDGPGVSLLTRVLRAESDVIAVLPMILTEVLQGFRRESGFRRAHELMTRLPILTPSLATHVEAARLFRRLRRHGVTVRGAVDCLIDSEQRGFTAACRTTRPSRGVRSGRRSGSPRRSDKAGNRGTAAAGRGEEA